MKTRKIAYLALASCTLLFASCSMNKNSVNTASLQSGKFETRQQLTYQHANQQKIASIDVPVNQNAIQNEPVSSTNNLSKVETPPVQRHLKSFAKNSFVKKNGNNLAQIITVSKVTSQISHLIKKPTRTASNKMNNPFEGMNYLLMWIIFLIASILLYFIAGLFAAATILSLLFDILGFIAGVFFLIFLILWIIQLYKASQK